VRKPRLSKLLSKKVLLSMAAVGTAGAMAGLGTFAAFTSTTSASNTASTGKVIISLGADGTANRFSQSSGTLVPGDTVQRAIDLISTSTTGDLGAVTLTTTASTSSVLDTPASADTLHMQIDNCVGGWTEAIALPTYTYTCGTTPTVVLASTPVIGSALALSNLSIVSTPGTDHLRLTLTLPSTAGDAFQNKSSTILYTFNATQRNATNR
jgi:spore coat-associated protein N